MDDLKRLNECLEKLHKALLSEDYSTDKKSSVLEALASSNFYNDIEKLKSKYRNDDELSNLLSIFSLVARNILKTQDQDVDFKIAITALKDAEKDINKERKIVRDSD